MLRMHELLYSVMGSTVCALYCSGGKVPSTVDDATGLPTIVILHNFVSLNFISTVSMCTEGTVEA